MSFATRSRAMDLEADALEAEELEEEAKQDDKAPKTSENKSGWCCFRTTSNSLIEIVVFVCLVLVDCAFCVIIRSWLVLRINIYLKKKLICLYIHACS